MFIFNIASTSYVLTFLLAVFICNSYLLDLSTVFTITAFITFISLFLCVLGVSQVYLIYYWNFLRYQFHTAVFFFTVLFISEQSFLCIYKNSKGECDQNLNLVIKYDRVAGPVHYIPSHPNLPKERGLKIYL